jgi:hypothetical protein
MQTGPRYVPLLRISLLQLEMVWIAIRDGTAVQQQDNKVMDEADKDAMAARRVSLAQSHLCERWQVYRSAAGSRSGSILFRNLVCLLPRV